MHLPHPTYFPRFGPLLGSVLLSFLVIGCESSTVAPDAGPPDADSGAMGADAASFACGDPGRTGQSPCATSIAGTCAPGQYCDGERLTCSDGCTSDADCGPTDRCERAAGEAVGACQSCPSCGDGRCQAPETSGICPVDCSVTPACGDGACEGSETPSTCPADCPVTPVCGDGVCEASESASACPADCSLSSLEACVATCTRAGACGAPVGEVDLCRADCGAATPEEQAALAACNHTDCGVMASCLGRECLGSAQCAVGVCVAGDCCGNGVCGDFEDAATCPADCTDDRLAACASECDSLDFFECGALGCHAACAASTADRRAAFLSCSNAVTCNYDACSTLL